MNFNASLDDIIKQNRSKIGLKTRKWKNKNAKPAFRSNSKKKQIQNPPVFKSKLRKRKILPDIPDARVKIIQNKKKLRRKSVGSMKSPLLQDARLKIEARRQSVSLQTRKQKKPVERPLRRDSAVTRLAANGIIQRRINPNLSNDNGIRVEYEDDEMNLENETVLRPGDWPGKFTIRRTVNNMPERKRYPPTLMGYRDLDAEPEQPMYYESTSMLPLNEVTRTITNMKASPTYRKNYSSPMFTSPLRRNSNEDLRDVPMRDISMRDVPMRDISMRDVSTSKSSMGSREQSYHRIMISNLHENVTSEDIKELFEDVGDLIYAKMVRNGMAEVAYKLEKDAMEAVEIYHNRQLDGLPMKCTLVRDFEMSSAKKRHSRIPPVTLHSSIEPDAHIIKKALFNK